MGSQQQFCLKWNNHQNNLVSMFEELSKDEMFCDVTIAVQDRTILSHKMVLAACSSYFRELLVNNPHEHPIILVPDVAFKEMQAILVYIYRGQVTIQQDQLADLLKAASSLKIKGLAEDVDPISRPEPEPAVSPAPQLPAHNGAHTNGFHLPLNLPTPSYSAYDKLAVQNQQVALWASQFADPHLLFSQSMAAARQPPPILNHLASSYETMADSSPLSRKKLAVRRDTPILRNVLGGQGDAPMHQNGYSNGTNGNLSPHDSDRRNSSELSEPIAEVEGCAAVTPQKPKGKEWKRYKQYSRQDIINAMNCVKRKEMSALAAASKFNIPSRTLYDKLKKAGILPLRTPGGANGKRRSESDDQQLSIMSSAQFPYSGALNGAVYGNNNGSAISESESDPTDTSSGLPRSTESEDVPMDMTSPRSSPAIHASVVINGHMSPPPARLLENHVEDLSINSRRSSSSSVIMPAIIKDEEPNEA